MSQDKINIKGTRHGLVILLDSNCAFEELKIDLTLKLQAANGFFNGAEFSLRREDMTDLPEEQKTELENICTQFGLLPYAGASAVLPKVKPFSPPVTTGAKVQKPHRTATPAPVTAVGKARPGEDAVLVRRSLRSGQRITAKGHVIVMGDVNYGAEVFASGSVYVLGHCRGVIHAGSEGDTMAQVVAWRLTPTVMSIAGQRQTSSAARTQPTVCETAKLKGKDFIYQPYVKSNA